MMEPAPSCRTVAGWAARSLGHEEHSMQTMRRMKELRIGISGWSYDGWRGPFYPRGLPRRRELEFASRRFGSIEINGSFYALQRPTSFARWYEAAPEGFLFAVKGSRFITHMKKLNEPEAPLANFFASGLLCLREKLGPILWQLPPNLGYHEARLAHFLELLPRSTRAAAQLARRHDARLEGRSWTRGLVDQPIRHAFEVRHPSFLEPGFIRLLRQYHAALVFADTAGHFPYAEEVTADFIYIRLHGAAQLYAGAYTDRQLGWWADRIRSWRGGGEPGDARRITRLRAPGQRGRDVFVYFDNDVGAHAPHDALRLTELLQERQRRRAA
jgi:uncharacterized protein YecE (DUF72 family)